MCSSSPFILTPAYNFIIKYFITLPFIHLSIFPEFYYTCSGAFGVCLCVWCWGLDPGNHSTTELYIPSLQFTSLDMTPCAYIWELF